MEESAEAKLPERKPWLIRLVLLSVVLYAVWLRPLNSPWHPFIAGDGLGYYAYLPATFIYHDKSYRFDWFNEAHNANYVYSAFENPEDNLLTVYGYRKINKYYQGLSYIWLPFFLPAHAFARVMKYKADGFSRPYQVFMGLASLFYLLIGLYYLRKLLLRLFLSDVTATAVTAVVFYGTNLCTYSVFANTLSHGYSFTFVALFLYFIQRLAENVNVTRYALLAALVYVIGVTIRPLNGAVILLVPVFVRLRTFRALNWRLAQGSAEVLIILLCLGAAAWTAVINFRQTGSLIAYNYGDEKFDFTDPRFFDALFSYHQGLFVYAPALFVSFFGVPFLGMRRRLIVPLFFLLVVFLYSCWWYWPITKRASIDFYALPAICLAALCVRTRGTTARTLVAGVLFCAVAYFQFKSYQFRKGILDENATYKDVFWRHFFRTHKANIYPIDPSTIIAAHMLETDVAGRFADKVDNTAGAPRKGALLLDSANYICRVAQSPMPAFFDRPGFRKIRFSFRCYFAEGVKSMHVFIQFFDHSGKMIREAPFYLNEEDIVAGRWDLKEFGHEIADNEGLDRARVASVGFTVWNVRPTARIWLTDPKAEFILTDRSFETIR
jgi:hypothetical protein